MKTVSILTGAAVVAILAGSGCASTEQQKFRLECRGAAASQFEECGNVYDTFTECKAAQQRMIRTPGLGVRDRGTCLKGYNR